MSLNITIAPAAHPHSASTARNVVHPAQREVTAGMRTLYIGVGQMKQVNATDAALVITTRDHKTLRYPVQRLARIVSSTTAHWSGPALGLCLRTGIPITWTDPQGHALGGTWASPRQGHTPALALEIWLQAPFGPVNYQHWLRSRRMHTLSHWVRQQPKSTCTTAADWEALKREWVYDDQDSLDTGPDLPPFFAGLLRAWVNTQLQAHELPAVLYGPKAECIELDSDLYGLLALELELHGGTLTRTRQTEAETIQLFESWIIHHGPSLLVHVQHLQRHALRLAYPA
jgi:CRISPR associated protein Cas1